VDDTALQPAKQLALYVFHTCSTQVWTTQLCNPPNSLPYTCSTCSTHGPRKCGRHSSATRESACPTHVPHTFHASVDNASPEPVKQLHTCPTHVPHKCGRHSSATRERAASHMFHATVDDGRRPLQPLQCSPNTWGGALAETSVWGFDAQGNARYRKRKLLEGTL